MTTEQTLTYDDVASGGLDGPERRALLSECMIDPTMSSDLKFKKKRSSVASKLGYNNKSLRNGTCEYHIQAWRPPLPVS